MGEIVKIVRDNFPADRLPEELRAGLKSGSVVRVTVEPEPERPSIRSLESYFGTVGNAHPDPVSDIRQLRDEWE